jgi:hypothetical protein
MPFRLQVSNVTSAESTLVVSGALLEGNYAGPEWVTLCDKSGEWISAQVLQHEITHPKSWPVVAGDGSTLILHISLPRPNFELDTAQAVVGRGALSHNERRTDITSALADPAFWAIQMSLHAASDVLPDPLVAWGFSQEDETRAYQRLLELHWDAGVWPFVRLPINNRFVEIEFAADVELQERIWLVDSAGRRVLMGYHSGHFSLPSFRIAEVMKLQKSWIAHPSAALLLLPGAYICTDDTLPLDAVTEWVKKIPGIEAGYVPKLVESLLENRAPDLQWKLDERLGWINNSSYSQRNPDGPMSVLGLDDFRFIHQFLGNDLSW